MSAQTLLFSSEAIGHVLADRWLDVPLYQRAYAWESEHVEEFWNDLSESKRDQRRYFLGAVVLTSSAANFSVIDGQQRLATTSLLLAAIRDELAAQGEDQLAEHVTSRYLAAYNPSLRRIAPKLSIVASDRQFYFQRFVERSGGDPESSSQRRLATAFGLLRDHVAALGYDGNGLMEWVDHLEQNVLVVLVEAETEADAFQIFETLNDRGAPLTIADLLKNYLMSVSPDSVEEISRAWDTAAGNLGTDSDTTDFVTFLRHYWSSVNGATRERDLYRSLRGRITEVESAQALAKDLTTASEHYAALLDSAHPIWADHALVASGSIRTLLYLQLRQYRPLLLAAMEFMSPEELTRLLEALVSWSVRGLFVGGIGGGTTERAYAAAGVSIRSGRIRSAGDAFNHLRPIIATDDEFRSAFEAASVPRVRLAQYVLRSIDRYMAHDGHPSIEPPQGGGPIVVPMLHRSSAAAEWPEFATDDVGRFASRIGNLFLRTPARQTLPSDWKSRKAHLVDAGFGVNESLDGVDVWSPSAVQRRQQRLAELGVLLWPRSGGLE